jgi:hypothetical protein
MVKERMIMITTIEHDLDYVRRQMNELAVARLAGADVSDDIHELELEEQRLLKIAKEA